MGARQALLLILALILGLALWVLAQALLVFPSPFSQLSLLVLFPEPESLATGIA